MSDQTNAPGTGEAPRAPTMGEEGYKMPRQGKILLGTFFGLWIGFVGVWLWVEHASPPALWVVSGLEVPITVQFGDHTVDFDGPGFEQVVDVSAGDHEVVVTTGDGQEVIRETVELHRGDPVAVYNVLGAALVYRERIHYGYGSNDDNLFRLLAGPANYYRVNDDDEYHLQFEDIPDVVSTSGGGAYYDFVGVPPGAKFHWEALLDWYVKYDMEDDIKATIERILPYTPNLRTMMQDALDAAGGEAAPADGE